MQQISNINIDTPCHASWNQMTPVEQGRHCAQCCKTVTDFTTMTNNEIIKYLGTSQHVCGRFDQARLADLNAALSTKPATLFGWKKLALAAALTGLFTSVKAELRSPAFTIQTIPTFKNTRDLPNADIVIYKTIKGKVFGMDDNLPLPGVTVKIKNSNIGTQTNTVGEFQLKVPVNAGWLEVSYIGFETYEAKVADFNNESNCVLLKMRSVIMGEVVVVKRHMPLHKRIWYKVKHIF